MIFPPFYGFKMINTEQAIYSSSPVFVYEIIWILKEETKRSASSVVSGILVLEIQWAQPQKDEFGDIIMLKVKEHEGHMHWKQNKLMKRTIHKKLFTKKIGGKWLRKVKIYSIINAQWLIYVYKALLTISPLT